MSVVINRTAWFLLLELSVRAAAAVFSLTARGRGWVARGSRTAAISTFLCLSLLDVDVQEFHLEKIRK